MINLTVLFTKMYYEGDMATPIGAGMPRWGFVDLASAWKTVEALAQMPSSAVLFQKFTATDIVIWTTGLPEVVRLHEALPDFEPHPRMGNGESDVRLEFTFHFHLSDTGKGNFNLLVGRTRKKLADHLDLCNAPVRNSLESLSAA